MSCPNESMGLSSIEASYDVLADKGLIIPPGRGKACLMNSILLPFE